MTTVFTDRKVVRLASRGLVNPDLQSAWRKKFGHDPVAISYAYWKWMRRQLCLGAGAIGMIVLFFVVMLTLMAGGKTGADLTSAQALFIVAPLAGAGLLFVPLVRYSVRTPRYTSAQRLFYEQVVRFAQKAGVTPEEIGAMTPKRLNAEAEKIMSADASEVLKHRESTKDFEAEKKAEIELSVDYRFLSDFERVSGSWDPFFDMARPERAAAKTAKVNPEMP